jgi:hypothetical protein
VNRIPEGAGRRGGRGRELAGRLAELFALAGLVIAQPVLDVTGRAPDFFVLRHADRHEILLLVAAVTVGPALALWAAGLLAGLAGQGAGRLWHLGAVTTLAALLAVEVGKHLLPLRGWPLVLAAALAGLAAGWQYDTRRWPGAWLRSLAPAPLVFALLFATVSPSATLLLASGADVRPGGPAADPGGRPPVVLVVFDEFPLQSLLDSSGRIDPRVYPNFAAVAGQATWYRNATGVSGFTQWAVPAMLTGRYPAKPRAPTVREYPGNLFTLFGQHYHLKANELVTQLCPVARCGRGGAGRGGTAALLRETVRLFGRVVRPYDADADPATLLDGPAAATTQPGADGTDGSDQAGRWAAFLDQIRRDDPQPTLYFEHVLLPHGPWHYLPDGTRYPAAPYGLRLRQDQYDPAVVDAGHQRHLLQLAYVDGLLGQLVARLKQQGLWDRSLVVLTADHGNGFSVGETARRLGDDNAASLMWVPLLVKAPHQTAGRVDDRNFEQVDLLPTLADLVHIAVPWQTDGVSQAGPPRRDRAEKSWYDTPGQRRVRDGPSLFPRVLHGVTDTLVQGRQGQRGLYRYGPDGRWTDRPPQAVGRLADPDKPATTARLLNWDPATAADPAAGQVPALLVGQLHGRLPPPDARIAVAVNGRIGAVVSLFADRPHAKPARFAAIVPDDLFHAGPALPQLQLYLVTRPADETLLRPVTLRG